MGSINQRNKKLEQLYFELADALAGTNLEYTITPLSQTPVYYRISVKGLFSYNGDYKMCEGFILGLQTAIDILSV